MKAGIKSALIAGMSEACLLPGALKSNEARVDSRIC